MHDMKDLLEQIDRELKLARKDKGQSADSSILYLFDNVHYLSDNQWQ